MHPNEPSIEELKIIQKELYVAESTDMNVKKLKAIELQIARVEKEAKKNESNG